MKAQVIGVQVTDYLPTKNNRQLFNKALLWRKIHIDLFGVSFRIMTKDWEHMIPCFEWGQAGDNHTHYKSLVYI